MGSVHPHGKREISIRRNSSISGHSWFVIYLVLNVKDNQDYSRLVEREGAPPVTGH